MSDNDIFYLMEDNTIGPEPGDAEIWVHLVDGLYWDIAWSQEESDDFIRINDKPGAPVKLMYRGTVSSVE